MNAVELVTPKESQLFLLCSCILWHSQLSLLCVDIVGTLLKSHLKTDLP